MMKKQHRHLFLLTAAAVLAAGAFYMLRDKPVVIETYTTAGRLPVIHPDYVDTVIPPNIAPLNFVVDEPGVRYYVRIRSAKGEVIKISSKDPCIEIPVGPWKTLLAANREQELHFDVYAKARNGGWTRFDTITNRIAPEEVDGYLVYRVVTLPTDYVNMAVYQRKLDSFEESLILDNDSFEYRCVNCHAFLNNRPDNMILHIREAPGSTPTAMLLARNGHIEKMDTRTRWNPRRAAGYISWHPSGRMAAFSTDKPELQIHSSGYVWDAYDDGLDVGVYRVDSNTVTTTASLCRPERNETFPSWSPDGRYLYFCSAPRLPMQRYQEIRYDLMRISYDMESDTWGKPETMLTASETGLSITQPRISPDGRFLLCCMADWGNFAILRPSGDLYMMDLETGHYRRLAINSDLADSWHSWSSNSRWIVFSSKRLDGVFSRPFFSYIDEEGRAHKPVLLPQEDPTFYDSFLKTFNLPELITEPVPITGPELVRVIRSTEEPVKAKLAPSAEAYIPPDAAEPEPSWEPAKKSGGGYR